VKNQERTVQKVLQSEMHKKCRASVSRTQDTHDHDMTQTLVCKIAQLEEIQLASRKVLIR